nr:MAG TPA: Sin3 binding region of histone deacetylase complex subunit SAP30 [Caudoviricetes sp.]
MRPRRNYGKHYATNVAPTNASQCSLIFIIHKHFF